MNIKTQMSQAAAKIYPYKSLAALCTSYSLGVERPEPDKKALRKIMQSNSFYLTPNWIAYYYPISEGALQHILRSEKLVPQ